MSAADDDEPGASPDLRELARKEPEAVRAIADRAGPPLSSWLQRVLAEVEERDAEDDQ